MLADWYLDMYFNEAGTFVDGILDGISHKLHEDDDIERVLGLAVAHAVRSHAVADIDLVMDDFASRALTSTSMISSVTARLTNREIW